MKHYVKHVEGLPDEDQWWAVILPGEEADEEVCTCNFEEQAKRIAAALNAVPELLFAFDWIFTDMTFAAPETFAMRAYRWQDAARLACERAGIEKTVTP